MKTLAVSDQRGQGPHLVIGEMPWPFRMVEALAGCYNPRWGWDWHLWSAVLHWCNRRDRELIRIPIEHTCTVADAMWPSREVGCWHGQPTYSLEEIQAELGGDP